MSLPSTNTTGWIDDKGGWHPPGPTVIYGTESSSGDWRDDLRDKFDNDPHNGDWRDDLMVIVGVLMLLVAFSIISWASLTNNLGIVLVAAMLTLFTGGITFLVVGLYIRLLGKVGR